MSNAIWNHTKASLIRGFVFVALIPSMLVIPPSAHAETRDTAHFPYLEQKAFASTHPAQVIGHTRSVRLGSLSSQGDAPLLIAKDMHHQYPMASVNRPEIKNNLAENIYNYSTQTGDTLPSLAARFQTTPNSIMEINPALRKDITTLQPGQVIHIYAHTETIYKPIFQILPDSAFINGPAQTNFHTKAFVDSQPGWLKDYVGYDGSTNQSAADIIDAAARDYHISPRLLLALLEYQTGALSKPVASQNDLDYPMGYANPRHKHLYNQVMHVSNLLNDGYYTWRVGEPVQFQSELDQDQNPDPRQNAATIALQRLFFTLKTKIEYQDAIYAQGFWTTYKKLFGDPWVDEKNHIIENLKQPELGLPFSPGKIWAFTGGPHTAWGDTGQPWAALDFAPPSLVFGCVVSNEWATAVADGVIVRSEDGLVTLDLDGDNDERTGWVIHYYHIASKDRVVAGKSVKRGDYIGHPSCEGGHATGSHIHIARLYNGEWILAYGPVAFNLEGWIAHRGDAVYQGTLTRQTQIVYANTNASDKTLLMSDVQLATTGLFIMKN